MLQVDLREAQRLPEAMKWEALAFLSLFRWQIPHVRLYPGVSPVTKTLFAGRAISD